MMRLAAAVLAVLLIVLGCVAFADAAKRGHARQATVGLAAPGFTYTPGDPYTGEQVTFTTISCGTGCRYQWADRPRSGGSWRLHNGSLRVTSLTFTFEPPALTAYIAVRKRTCGTCTWGRWTYADGGTRRSSAFGIPVKQGPRPPAPDPTPTPTPSPDPTPEPTPSPDPTPEPTPTPTPDPEPDPTLPPLAQPSCVSGSVSASSGAAIRSALQGGQNACVTTTVGNIDLSDLRLNAARTLGTEGAGRIGEIRIGGSSNLTLRARFRSTKITLSDHITIEQSRIGGEPNARIMDMLVFVAEPSDDITIRDSELAWTTSDTSGNTGFGIRVYNDSDNLTVQRNYIHHVGGDAMQISISGENALIDRNEVAYAAKAPTGSDEHSDDLQMAGQGPNNVVSNNWFHHCGWWMETGPQTGCNALAIHAGSSNTFLYENNLQEYALGIPDLGDLGTGGCSRSNTTWRRNTWRNNGTQFSSGLDVNYAFCGGSNNLFERNLTIAQFGNKYGFAASGTTARDNLDGNYELDANGECVSAACNPAGEEPIGYRKPSGVHW